MSIAIEWLNWLLVRYMTLVAGIGKATSKLLSGTDLCRDEGVAGNRGVWEGLSPPQPTRGIVISH